MNNKSGHRNFKKRKYSFERNENPLNTKFNNKILDKLIKNKLTN